MEAWVRVRAHFILELNGLGDRGGGVVDVDVDDEVDVDVDVDAGRACEREEGKCSGRQGRRRRRQVGRRSQEEPQALRHTLPPDKKWRCCVVWNVQH